MSEADDLNKAISRAWDEEVFNRPDNPDRDEAIKRTQTAIAQSFAKLENRVEAVEKKLKKREQDERSARARFGAR